jgi:hypothetical protein
MKEKIRGRNSLLYIAGMLGTLGLIGYGLHLQTAAGLGPATTTSTVNPTFPGDDFTAGTASLQLEPFGTVTIQADFEVNGQGRNVDSIAFWEAPDPAKTLMFVTAKGNQLVEVWQYPFVDNELPPLQHSTFGRDTAVNGVAVNQEQDLLYISVSEPASTVSVFSLPQLQFSREFVAGSVNLKAEPNITLLDESNGGKRAYVSADTIVYIYDAESGAALGHFNPSKGLETMAADPIYQAILIPDENDKTGVYVYQPDGAPFNKGNTNHFAQDRVFQSDGEGILLYTCPSNGQNDNGTGLIVVADQKNNQTDFEIFHRQTWQHLGTVMIEGVANTDGIGSSQRPLPGYPLGLFAAVNDDATVVGVGWDKILNATGLSCAADLEPATVTPLPQATSQASQERDKACLNR